MSCLFCKIINREVVSTIVFENDNILAFRDIGPQAPVHILIIPKRHISGLNGVTPDDNQLLGEIQNVAREIARSEKIDKSGYRLVCNCGQDAGQAVEHIHYHLLGGRKFGWPPG
ncbi:MAG TPA: histidine triad nucleotide-binding protein [Elusimicrobia bacterium]|nr:MAG: histidine triad nucleotide-binding protein [Elusimicrobia bacterium RIFOXYA12_FULL_49_49]OGS10000.1 MAG: histidine triad nucleotide-binding protein [Elusimicrobia bacterium RIFOXYA1_FULL_47_7]OGS11765.1 MAG: histidine triad nucleotide-binding protein [Elusimicrobia bacterium RIFOXYB1_FULL_48_9]OGS15601.1 MAG: histidine triad nucleotide-binding protein [Elusimicrobia bacterium RIFOXYA2_FULL_47_53]OGS30700.1 MAG: histidine triad nucleotide-binding protein [Elusimicrobia bacterium RIFOXYB2